MHPHPSLSFSTKGSVLTSSNRTIKDLTSNTIILTTKYSFCFPTAIFMNNDTVVCF